MAGKNTLKPGQPLQRGNLAMILLGILACLLLWGYWNSLREAAVYWEGAQYSHGFLIPLFSCFLLWLRRLGTSDAPMVSDATDRRVMEIGGGLLGVAIVCAWGLPAILPEAAGEILAQVAPWLYLASLLVVAGAAVTIWYQLQEDKSVHALERWSGVALLVVGLGGRMMCALLALDIPDMYMFIPSLLGILMLVGGWHLLRWAGPVVCFLFFMFPLPWAVEQWLLTPLQDVATDVSTYALQTLGVEAYNDGGNRICIEEMKIGVVDQCSGLRMTTIFLALSVAVVLLLDRPWWENLIILLSAIPIALTVNVVRITATGLLFRMEWGDWGHTLGHDGAGWLMMPLALIFMWLELVILSKLFVEVDDDVPVPMWGRWR